MVEILVDNKDPKEPVKDPELEQLMKDRLTKRSKGKGSGIPQVPKPPVDQPPMQFDQIVMQQIAQLKQQQNNMDRGLQQTMQMINALARPDMNLQPVVDTWKNSDYKNILIGFHEGFKMAVIGNIEPSSTEWYTIKTIDQGTITVRKDIVLMRYTKTVEMIESDRKRKEERELERERRAKEVEEQLKAQEKGPVRDDNKVTEKPTRKSSE